MNWQGKIWGKTATIYSDHNIELNLIYAKRGGYCSKHQHMAKFNLFFVFSGMLKIDVWKNDYDLVDDTVIKRFESTVVKPRENHKFKALKNTWALELYWVKLCLNDIQREDVGGTNL